MVLAARVGRGEGHCSLLVCVEKGEEGATMHARGKASSAEFQKAVYRGRQCTVRSRYGRRETFTFGLYGTWLFLLHKLQPFLSPNSYTHRPGSHTGPILHAYRSPHPQTHHHVQTQLVYDRAYSRVI